MNKSHVLIVEDESRVAVLLADYLQRAGFMTTALNRGDLVMPWLDTHDTDLILLDLMLPGVRGELICANLRKSQNEVPIIMITAKAEESDRILGLELGADDYMCKPLSPREVVARVKAALRRQKPGAWPAPEPVQLDSARLQINFNGKCIQVTSIEFRLMHLLMTDPGRIYSRDVIMHNLYPDKRIVHDRTVDGHVKKLRQKLKYLFDDWEAIPAVYGAGYRYASPPLHNPSG